MRFLKRFAIFLLIVGVIAVCWFQWWHLSKSIIPLAESAQKGNLHFTLSSPLPIRITEGGGTAYENKFYVAGGIDAFGRTLNTFYEFDNLTASWTRLPDMPAYINHPGVVAANGKVFGRVAEVYAILGKELAVCSAACDGDTERLTDD